MHGVWDILELHYRAFLKQMRGVIKGVIRCSTDGDQGNPRDSAYRLIFRDHEVDLIYAQAEEIGIAMNMEAQARAMKIALWISEERD